MSITGDWPTCPGPENYNDPGEPCEHGVYGPHKILVARTEPAATGGEWRYHNDDGEEWLVDSLGLHYAPEHIPAVLNALEARAAAWEREVALKESSRKYAVKFWQAADARAEAAEARAARLEAKARWADQHAEMLQMPGYKASRWDKAWLRRYLALAPTPTQEQV